LARIGFWAAAARRVCSAAHASIFTGAPASGAQDRRARQLPQHLSHVLAVYPIAAIGVEALVSILIRRDQPHPVALENLVQARDEIVVSQQVVRD